MYLYKQEKRYNQRTGQEIEPEFIRCGFICDFTGERLELEKSYCYDEEKPLYGIAFKYDSGSEPDWYYDEVEKLVDLINPGPERDDALDDHAVRRFLAEEPFHFLLCEDGSDPSLELVNLWFEHLRVSKGVLSKSITIAHAFRTYRKDLLTKLIKNKKINPINELGIGIDYD